LRTSKFLISRKAKRARKARKAKRSTPSLEGEKKTCEPGRIETR
jgi:hypothetical protein